MHYYYYYYYYYYYSKFHFCLFNVQFKSQNCPSVIYALASNSICSDTDIFNGSSVSVNDLLVSDTLTRYFRIFKQIY